MLLGVGNFLGTLFGGIAFFDPVCGEIVGEEQDAQLGEAHLAEGGEGGAQIRAAIEGAAAAVNDEIRGARYTLRPFLEVGEGLVGLRGAMEESARNVSACVERTESDADHYRLC